MKTIWLFGPSGTGKTTVGEILVKRIKALDRPCEFIDGDELRKTVCASLGFSYPDRKEQTKRAAHIAKQVNDGGAWAVVALITPYTEFRKLAGDIIADMVPVYLRSSKASRMDRDPKGLYKLAAQGMLNAKLTGYDGRFDEPDEFEAFIVDTDNGATPEETAQAILALAIGPALHEGDGI